jgi:hypothetical protein
MYSHRTCQRCCCGGQTCVGGVLVRWWVLRVWMGALVLVPAGAGTIVSASIGIVGSVIGRIATAPPHPLLLPPPSPLRRRPKRLLSAPASLCSGHSLLPLLQRGLYLGQQLNQAGDREGISHGNSVG